MAMFDELHHHLDKNENKKHSCYHIITKTYQSIDLNHLDPAFILSFTSGSIFSRHFSTFFRFNIFGKNSVDKQKGSDGKICTDILRQGKNGKNCFCSVEASFLDYIFDYGINAKLVFFAIHVFFFTFSVRMLKG